MWSTFSPHIRSDLGLYCASIIAVHGLNPRSSSSHAADTWEKEGHSWLKESLPKLTPNARIWMYSYNSTVVYGKDKSSFVQKADEFLERIRVKRIEDPKRPLVLIGHSLGGLLLEQALVNAHNNPKYTHIKDATAGLAFFATPHNGGNPKLLTLGNITSKIARGTGFEQNKDVLETLKDDSIFTGILQEHRSPADGSLLRKIVSDKSAKFGTLPGNVENVVKLAGGHSDICRFNPKDDVDADNLELVLCNIKELYDIALRESESESSKLPTKLLGLQFLSEASQAHRTNPTVADDDLESRLQRLREGNLSAS
ncbi:alpha/beta-Hydrolase [Alternaria alternata]|nr:alpha/beta-Hydrolase [Alternaria alternata]